MIGLGLDARWIGLAGRLKDSATWRASTFTTYTKEAQANFFGKHCVGETVCRTLSSTPRRYPSTEWPVPSETRGRSKSWIASKPPPPGPARNKRPSAPDRFSCHICLQGRQTICLSQCVSIVSVQVIGFADRLAWRAPAGQSVVQNSIQRRVLFPLLLFFPFHPASQPAHPPTMVTRLAHANILAGIMWWTQGGGRGHVSFYAYGSFLPYAISQQHVFFVYELVSVFLGRDRTEEKMQDGDDRVRLQPTAAFRRPPILAALSVSLFLFVISFPLVAFGMSCHIFLSTVHSTPPSPA